MRHARSIGITLALLALTVSGCRTISPVEDVPQAPVPVSAIQFEAGEWRVTDLVVVVTDASGTMYVNETFPAAKALTESFVQAMPAADAPARSPEYDAGAIGFGGSDRMTVPLEPFNRAALAHQASDLEIMGSVDGMGGTTPLHAVIDEAAVSLEGKMGRAALVVISDGLPDNPVAALGAGEVLIASRSSQTCIHAVQTGNSTDGQAFLKQLSELSNCGSLRNASEATSAAEVQYLARSVFAGLGTPAVAAPNPCRDRVRLSGIEFAFDRSTLSEKSKEVLSVAVRQLGECPEIRLTVSGYTDSIGTATYNNGLSFRRADAAKDYLIAHGVKASRLDAEGFGESDPVASNGTAVGRAENRRVELAPID